MATLQTLGPNSAIIHYVSGEIASLFTPLNAFLTSKGWTLWDAAAGVNTKCYRAPNKDGVTFKFMTVEFRANGNMYVNVYEAWDAVTRAGTNITYCGVDGFNYSTFGLLNGGSLYVFASPRYCLLWARPNAANWSLYSPHGCVEVTRDNVEDTAAAGIPCFGQVCGYRMTDNLAGIYYPRVLGGGVGINASPNGLVSSPGNCNSSFAILGGRTGVVTSGQNTNIYVGITALNDMGAPIQPNPFNGKIQAFDVWSFSDHALYGMGFRGRIYGFKFLTAAFPQPMQRLTLKVDTEGFLSSTGADSDWLVMPLHLMNGSCYLAIPL